MYRLITTIVLLFGIISAHGQKYSRYEVDSLLRSLSRSSQDTSGIKLLLALAEFQISKPGEFKADLDSAAVYVEQARHINEKITSPEAEAHISLTSSLLARERGQKELSRSFAEKAVQILSKGTDKYELGQAYLGLSECYNYLDEAELPAKIQLVKKATDIFKQGGYIEREAYCYIAYSRLDKGPDTTLERLKTALSLYQSIHYTNLQSIYDLIGNTYYRLSNFILSLDYELKALKAAQDSHDTSMQLCDINNHIGITYFQMIEYEKAVTYFKAALITAQSFKDVSKIHTLTLNIGDTYIRLNKPREALEIFQTVLKNFPVPPNDILNDCRFATNFLRAYINLNQFDLAKPYCDHLLNIISRSHLSNDQLLNIHVWVVDYFFVTKQYSNMQIFLVKNDTISRQLGNPAYISANNNWWFKLDTAQHNYKGAVQHLLVSKRIQDTLFTQNKAKQFQQLQVQFDTREKENQIALLNQKAALSQSNLQRADLLKNVTIGGIVLVLIIAGLLYRQNGLKRKSNRIITGKNELLQDLVQEKEWLLKEVHHRVKNNLHTLLCLLESQASHLQNEGLAAVEVSQHRIYAMSLIHQKLYQSEDIRTVLIDKYIAEFVDYLRDSFEGRSEVHFMLDIEPIRLAVSQAIPLALIINEAVTNSMKYAFPDKRPGTITISMHKSGEQITLVLGDNGVGIGDRPRSPQAGSLGLELMTGLSKEIHGRVEFTNDSGTKITIIFERDTSFVEGRYTSRGTDKSYLGHY